VAPGNGLWASRYKTTRLCERLTPADGLKGPPNDSMDSTVRRSLTPSDGLITLVEVQPVINKTKSKQMNLDLRVIMFISSNSFFQELLLSFLYSGYDGLRRIH
jgi:hypothetical protein